ncbi:MAG: secondary thiamine-phosphate synthase [Acidiferrobacteraceae bacterium]|nr:secondary thiamine-phosphate synthase [Acidiferrobacteraceae bacterium]
MLTPETVWFQDELQVRTEGRGTCDITRDVRTLVGRSEVRTGLCHIFIRHTSASLMLCENAAVEVRGDLEGFMQRIAPDGDTSYRHHDEGPDDMAAHIRTVLTDVSLQIPVSNEQLLLGTWQGIYLWEHRLQAHQRHVVVTVAGVKS